MAPKRKADAPAAGAPAAKKGTIPVDASVPSAKDYKVVGDKNAKLNQTDIGNNNNKYYFIQLLSKGDKYFVWTRWGRVGYATESKSAMDGPKDLAGAEKAFKKKFAEKTRNDWDKIKAGTPFAAKPGKYTLIDVEESAGGKSAAKKAAAAPSGKTSLNKDLAAVLKVIFNVNMFKEQMAKMKVDVGKLPLGQLTKAQIAKGNAILGKIKMELDKTKRNGAQLTKLSGEFYTLIPHNFGFKKPPLIDSESLWSDKVDLINMLNDIGMAHQMQGTGGDPLSDSYKKLNNKMTLLPPTDKVHKVITKYFTATKRGSFKLHQVFSVERAGEKGRMTAHKSIGNRRLLWHGTNPAVVAAILSGGLRIMPHSGGRVGKGIYLASEHSKSLGYTGFTRVDGKQCGFMFLVEAALGRQSEITRDNPRLKAAPSGYHSVLAQGRTESFDPKTDAKIPGPFGDVSVPQQAPKTSKFKTSSFRQSEYLVYKESQAMLRYLCLVRT